MSDFKEWLEQVKQSAACRIEDVIGEDYALKRQGKAWVAVEHDSLTVYPETQTYKWYSKGEDHKGDVVNWLVNHRGWTRPQTYEWLAQRSGIERKLSEEQLQAARVRRKKQAALTVIAEYFQGLLRQTPAALDYCHGRGWDDEAIGAARLGFNDGNRAELIGHLRMHEVDETADVVKAVLRIPEEHLVYCHYEGSRCVYLTSRTIRKGDKKAMYQRGYLPHFNLPEALAGERRPYFNQAYARGRHEQAVVIVEGQADAVSLGQLGVPAVALAGLSKLGPLLQALDKHNVREVIAGLDREAPGSAPYEAVRRTVDALARRYGTQMKVILWPKPAKDANDWLQEASPTAEQMGELVAESPIYAAYVAMHRSYVEPALRDQAQREAYEAMARLEPYDYAANSSDLAMLMAVKVSELNRVVRAIQKEWAAAAAEAEQEQEHKPLVSVAERFGFEMPELSEYQRDLLLNQTSDHEGHAQCVLKLYGNQVAFVPAWGWLTYDGKKWNRDAGEQLVDRLVVNTLKARAHLAVNDERLKLYEACKGSRYNIVHTRDQLATLVVALPEDFDSDVDRLNADNGIVDLRTGELEPHDPKHRFTWCIPTRYVKGAKSTEWETFLIRSLGPAIAMGKREIINELLDYIQGSVGYSLTGHASEECLFYIFGPTRSGKGTFMGTLLAMLGDRVAKGIEFQSLLTERHGDTSNFDLAGLSASRLLSASESGKYQRLNAAKVKQITGQDPIRCSFKRRDHFTYTPQFKVWLQSNYPFNGDVYDAALWNRVRIIHFPKSHAGEEDKGLKRRLQEPWNLEGVLAWAVEGAMEWYAAGRDLFVPDVIKESTQAQRDDQDMLKQFFENECKVADPKKMDVRTTNSQIRKRYNEWCNEQDIKKMQMRTFYLALKDKGFEPFRTTINGSTERGYYGIQLKMKRAEGQLSMLGDE